MDKMMEYFVKEKGETEIVARMLAKKLNKYEDIRESFLNWIDTRNYDERIQILGYSAKSIHELQPQMDASGVYQFLVTLRDNPENAEKYIKSNFSTK